MANYKEEARMFAPLESQGTGREYMSVAEYFAREETAVEKHEYRDGYRYPRHAGPHAFEAMAGARESHVRLGMRLSRFIGQHLEDSPCIPYAADMRLAPNERAYFYPDLFVTCHPATGPTVLVQRDAILVVEITSPGTEGDDRGDKFHQYQQLPSLREYLILSAEELHADLFRRGPEGLWVLHPVGPDDELVLENISFHLPMNLLYQGVELHGGASA